MPKGIKKGFLYMKKLICLLLLSATLLSSLTACANNTASGDAPAETTGGAVTEGDTQKESALSKLSLREIADSIQSSEFEYPSLMEMPLEDNEFFKTNFGIERPAGLKEALLIMPAMSSIACSIGLLRFEGETDAKTVAQEMEGSLDTHQWVCAQPSFVQAIARGNVVLLIVEGDDARGQAMVDAFKAL